MKKIIVILAALLMSTGLFAQKIASVNFQECVALQDAYKAAMLDLGRAQADNQEVYNSMVADYQNKIQAYQQKAASWTDAVRGAKEKEIQDLEGRIQEFAQTSQQELQQIQQNLQAPVVEKAQAAIEKVAKAGSYLLVVDKSSVVYIDANQTDDITAKVRKELGIPADRSIESFSQEVQAAMQALMGAE